MVSLALVPLSPEFSGGGESEISGDCGADTACEVGRTTADCARGLEGGLTMDDTGEGFSPPLSLRWDKDKGEGRSGAEPGLFCAEEALLGVEVEDVEEGATREDWDREEFREADDARPVSDR
jgi:hypothetical protein